METCLFEPGTVPDFTTPEWYAQRERAAHLEEPMHARRLELAAEFVKIGLDRGLFHTVVDLGCGDGGLLSLISRFGVSCWGYDLQQSNIIAARQERQVRAYLVDVVDPEAGLTWGQCAVCTECLEHLVDPHGFLKRVAEHSRVLVASSPLTETADSHYGHHAWCWDADGYRKMVEAAGFTVEQHESDGGMFQVLMGVRR